MPDRISVIRKQYLRRMDKGEVVLCGLCGGAIPRKATGANKIINGGLGGLSIDHIIEKSRGGSNRVDNLQPTHVRCNFEKSHPIITHRSMKLMEQAEREGSQ